MRDLEPIRAAAADALDAATYDLRVAARTLAHDDPQGAVCLARTAVLLGAAVARAPIVTTPGLHPASDTAESWLLAAAKLHEGLADAYDGSVRLWYAALDAKQVPVPEAALVQPDDMDLFRHAPTGDWRSPFAVAHIEGLALRDRPAARERRAAIVAATEAWAREHQRAEVRSGFAPLEECCRALNRGMRSVRAGMAETPTRTLAGARVKAAAAARSLVEFGDDPRAIDGVLRGYMAECDAEDSNTLAWAVVRDVLAGAERTS